MKNWSSIVVFVFLLGCTSLSDKDSTQELEKVIASQGATIDSLQLVLLSTEGGYDGSGGQESYASFPATAKLYEAIGFSEIEDYEFAEVLAIAEADTAFGSSDYEVRVYLACNGPADPELEECNCSHYAYVTTGTYDMPHDYRLFKVGPFFLPEFSKWGGTKEQPELTIEHQVKGKAERTVIKVLNFEKVFLDNRT